MEQKAKRYEELSKYERVMANTSIEQRLEGMAKELQQIALALKFSIHVDTTFHNWGDESYTSVDIAFISGDAIATREVKEEGSLLGIIEEALSKKTAGTD